MDVSLLLQSYTAEGVKVIKIRPHHLLDLVRDYGNNYKKPPHPWGASVESVSDMIFSDIHQEVEMVMGVDSICETCNRLNDGICEAHINEDLLMRNYNDPLDEKLFSSLEIRPGDKLSVYEFLKIVSDRMFVLDLFNSPTNKKRVRRKGTELALMKFGLV